MATLTSTLIVRLLDKVSGPAKGVASAITGISRAADGAGSSMAGRIQGAMERNSAALERTRGQLFDAAAGFFVLKRGLTSVISPAVSFESAMADVAKVSGLDDKGIELYGKQLRNLAVNEIPMAVEELAALSAAAAQSGVADDELLEFTRMTAKAAVAWEMSGAAAGESLAKIKAQLQLTTAQTELFASAINHLSDNSAASAGDLVDYARRVSAQGEFYGYSKEQTLAFGSAMVGTGAQAEVAATSFRNMGRALTRGASAPKRMAAAYKTLGLDAEKVAKAMQEDAVGTTLKVIEKLGQLPEYMQAATLTDLFGDEARALAPLLNKIDILKQSLGLVADETQYASSVNDEFARRAATAEYAWQRFKNQLRDVALTIGGTLLPSLRDIMAELGPIVLKFSDFAAKHPGVVKAVVAITTGLIGLRVALIGVRFAALMARGGLLSMMLPVARLGGWASKAAGGAVALQSSLAALSGVKYTRMQKVGTALGGIARAIPGIGLLSGMGQGIAVAVGALTAPAWGAIAIGVGAVAVAGAAIYKYWDRLTSIFAGVGRAIGEQLAPAIEAVKPYLEWLAPIGEGIAAGWQMAKDAVSGFGGWIASFFSQEVLNEEQKAEWENAGHEAATRMIEAIKSVFGGLADWALGVGRRVGGAISNGAISMLNSAKSYFGGGDAPANDNVEARAKGGTVRKGRTYLVGERGAEIRTDLGNGRIIPNNETMRLLRGGGSGRIGDGASSGGQAAARVSVDMRGMVVNGVKDARAFADEVERELNSRLRSSLRALHADG